jgi:hypothetical protein
MISRRGAEAQGKARTKEWVSRNGATHAKGGKEKAKACLTQRSQGTQRKTVTGKL